MWKIWVLFLPLLFTLTGCTTASDSSLRSGEFQPCATSSDPSKTILIPTQEKTEGERAVTEKLFG